MGDVRIRDIAHIMNIIAPEDTAADFDNAGLLVGDPEKEVTGITVALDVDGAVIDFAVKNGCNLIITHHPLIFLPIKSVTTETPVGSLVYSLFRAARRFIVRIPILTRQTAAVTMYLHMI